MNIQTRTHGDPRRTQLAQEQEGAVYTLQIRNPSRGAGRGGTMGSEIGARDSEQLQLA